MDLYTLTVGLRARWPHVRRRPPGIAGVEQSWWWNPLAGIRDYGRRRAFRSGISPARSGRAATARSLLHQGRRAAAVPARPRRGV
ncbi:hypothetical protein HBB16_09495 [Pseudonocardia sp. MCCB 268]|nr:hypothetical protein [Pseudonocardia cytotoxica]